MKFPKSQVYLYRMDYTEPSINDKLLTRNKAQFVYQMLVTSGKLAEIGLGWAFFDGKYQIYAQKDIGDAPKKVTVDLETPAEAAEAVKKAAGKERKIRRQTVQFKKVKTVPIFGDEMKDNTIQALELQIMHILTHKNPEKFMKKQRSIFELEKVKPIQDTDMSIIPGYYHQLSQAQIGPVLCSDVTYLAGMSKMTLLQYIYLKLSTLTNMRGLDLVKFFSDKRMVNMRKALSKDLMARQIKLDHLAGGRAKKIFKLSAGTPKSHEFEQEDKSTGKKQKISVNDYFLRTYKKKLEHPDVYPMIVIKRPTGQEDYYPLDVCSIVPFQPKGNLTTEERSVIINETRKDLEERFREVIKHAQDLASTFSNKDSSNFLGIEVDPAPLVVEGRILAPPVIIYGKDTKQKNVEVEPKGGVWNIQEIPLFQPKNAIDLLALTSDRIGIGSADKFVTELEQVSKNSGVLFSTSCLLEYRSGNEEHVQIKKMIEEEKKKGKKNLFVLVMLDSKDSMKYNLIKNELDLTSQVASQFVVRKNVEKFSGSLLGNIVNAINVKASSQEGFGVNAIVDLPILRKVPTTCIGIDVYHAPPGSARPSEAAISASINMTATRYFSTSRSQESRKEGIADIKGMFAEVLAEALNQLKGTPFVQFIVIRDGVAETQFIDICNAEIKALKDAVAANKAYAGKQIQILYMIAQKRNIARIAISQDGSFHTPPAGTVIDSKITGRTKEDFYILPHKAIIGSAKPIHYHVVQNDMKLTLEQIQELIFKLCHLHPGCTRSVSLPAPLYNAHKLGYRIGQVYRPAMEYHSQFDDTKSESSGSSGYNYEPVNIPHNLKYTPFYL
eukprot:TRINITY_DN4789_c0_g2_i1.p1 TRINITY_DN4789_c0_g2~~TRINITY_DN4789_c0_g2_i1.p1  ORF type:complete len:869 (+),score=226.55 TRINITY_DN4789_c0_g2_i1:97-2607(+)